MVPSRYALRVGEIDVLVVSDGVLPLPTAMLAHNADPAARAAWLDDMFLPPDAFDWALNVVPVRSGGQTILIDAGLWLHLAVVLDGNGKRVVQYVNGLQVSAKALKVNPPFRVGAAELGNWNASGFRENDPSLIRNFSGAMDEFCLFSRALNTDEIRKLYSAGKPQPDPFVQNRN